MSASASGRRNSFTQALPASEARAMMYTHCVRDSNSFATFSGQAGANTWVGTSSAESGAASGGVSGWRAPRHAPRIAPVRC